MIQLDKKSMEGYYLNSVAQANDLRYSIDDALKTLQEALKVAST
jgi:hypothetical protein